MPYRCSENQSFGAENLSNFADSTASVAHSMAVSEISLMPTPFEQARRWFPKMPEELFSLWFDERIEVNGWPPTSRAWHQVLCYKTLQFWQNLNWKKREFDLAGVQFGAETLRVVNGLIRSNMLGETNELTQIRDSSLRTVSIMDFVQKNKRLPGTLIFIEDNRVFEIVEGCHRLAIFCRFYPYEHTRGSVSAMCSAWIGSLGQKSLRH
jgi:hypothetical protein